MAYKLLSQTSFWLVNKSIAKLFKSNDTALLLSDLIDKSEYFKSRGELTPDGFFFNTSERIEEDTNISYFKQKKCIEKLVDAGFVETDLRGIPAILHFKVIENKISNFLNHSIEENQKLDLKFLKTNNNKSNNNKKRECEEEENTHTPTFVKEQRERLLVTVSNSLTFKQESNSYEAMKNYLNESIIPKLIQNPSIQKIISTSEKVFLKKTLEDFCELYSSTQVWGNERKQGKDDLLQHIISFIKKKHK